MAVSATPTRAPCDMRLGKLHRAGSRRFPVDPRTCLLASCFYPCLSVPGIGRFVHMAAYYVLRLYVSPIPSGE